MTSRRDQLDKIFSVVAENERDLLSPLLDEVCFLEDQMAALKQLPFISVHPTKPALQKPTAAAKQYKECSQSYMNAIRILCGVLNKTEVSAEDELLERLKEFAL